MALGAALLLFIYLTFIGTATAQAIGFRFGVLRGWLLAPVTGLSVLMIFVMTLNQAGIPVRHFALALTLVLLASSGAVFWWRPPVLPMRRLWPFWAVLAFALFYIGWPAIRDGFNWTGYSNADALAYCQSASRIMDHGFFEIPPLADLLGRDYTQVSWFQFGPGLYRCGFDLVLAWSASVARMNPFAIYMPLMLCLGLIQISAAAALVLSGARHRRTALLACAFLAMSPLFGFSVIAQVGPQTGGLAILLGLCALTLAHGAGGWRSAARRGAVVALVGLGLVVFYPELLPFWGLSYMAFQLVSLLRGRVGIMFQLKAAAIAGLLMAVFGRANLLRGYFSVVFAIMFSRATESGQAIAYTGFETMKLPHGSAVLFGLSDAQRLPPNAWLFFVVVVGFVLIVICLWRGVADALKLQPYAFLFLTLALLAAALFRSPNAFGLFKMALFVQPLLMATVAASVNRLPRTGIGAAVAVYLLASAAPHAMAVTQSTGALPGLASVGVNLPKQAGGIVFETDAPTDVPAALLQIYLKGVPQEMLNGRATPRISAKWVKLYEEPLVGGLNPYTAELAASDRLSNELNDAYRNIECLGFNVWLQPHQFAGRLVLASLTSKGRQFNGMQKTADGQFFTYLEAASVRNFLAFINSDKSHDYYQFSEAASYYALENDLFRPGARFYGIGRYFLFEVLNPSDTFRVRMSISKTLMGDGRTNLPNHAKILSGQEAPVGLVGSGAANIFSPPVHSAYIEGRHFVGIDFEDELISPPNRKEGIMRLYNRQIPLDVRKLIGYGRDISVISEEDYRRLERPRSISRWPEDLLRGAGVEFSGFYEDGWVSNRAFLKLGPSKPGEHLTIRGDVPGIGSLAAAGNVLTVRINGVIAATEVLHPGSFEVNIPISQAMDVTTVDLGFALQQNLPSPDDRPVAAHIQELAVR